jgi:hypothetical protein
MGESVSKLNNVLNMVVTPVGFCNVVGYVLEPIVIPFIGIVASKVAALVAVADTLYVTHKYDVAGGILYGTPVPEFAALNVTDPALNDWAVAPIGVALLKFVVLPTNNRTRDTSVLVAVPAKFTVNEFRLSAPELPSTTSAKRKMGTLVLDMVVAVTFDCIAVILVKVLATLVIVNDGSVPFIGKLPACKLTEPGTNPNVSPFERVTFGVEALSIATTKY